MPFFFSQNSRTIETEKYYTFLYHVHDILCYRDMRLTQDVRLDIPPVSYGAFAN